MAPSPRFIGDGWSHSRNRRNGRVTLVKCDDNDTHHPLSATVKPQMPN
jgi:hypothetical protein